MRIIDNQRGGGGTELCAALQTAFALPKTDGVARSMIVVTDGYIAEESEAFDFIRDHLNATNVFSFGIGSAVNRHLIEGVARAGMGEPFVITKPEEANASAERFREYIASPVLTGLTLQGDGVELYDMEPKTIPDVFASRPVVVTGKYRGNAKGALSLRGYTAGGSYDQHFAITKDMPSPKNRALRQLWARSRLTTLADFGRGNDDQDTRAQIVNIGLGYSLLTKYTSFIAVHERVRTNAAGTDVTQPLPMPEGVSDHAVGVTNGSEPELVILLLVVAIAFVLGRRRARGVA